MADRQKLLIVDDSPTNIQVLSEILAPEYQIFFATGGARALDIAHRQELDLILLDVVMPEMDGYAVCRALKEEEATRHIPVIFVTAMSEVEDEAKGFALGAVDYITKPVSPPVVQARVRTHLELKSQRDYLHRLTTIDGLTGIANRRRFDEALAREWLRARRDGTPLSLLLIDVDHFKLFNDHYGHLAGDDCLRQVAQALAGALDRPGDLVARYGGEEFACILPGSDGAGTCTVAGRLLSRVRELAIPHQHSPAAPWITLSIGAVTAGGGNAPDASRLLAAADELLYEAKRGGRDRFLHTQVDPEPA